MSSGTTEHERTMCRTALWWLAGKLRFRVSNVSWAAPRDSAAPNVEGIAETSAGQLLLEHTLLEAFSGEKTKDARFIRLANALGGLTWSQVPVPVHVQFGMDYDHAVTSTGDADRLALAVARQLGALAAALEPDSFAEIEAHGVRVVVRRRRQGTRPVTAGRVLPQILDQRAAVAKVLRARLSDKSRKVGRMPGQCLLVLEARSMLLPLGLAADALREVVSELRPFEHVVVIETGGEQSRPPWFLHAAKLAGAVALDQARWDFVAVDPIEQDTDLTGP